MKGLPFTCYENFWLIFFLTIYLQTYLKSCNRWSAFNAGHILIPHSLNRKAYPQSVAVHLPRCLGITSLKKPADFTYQGAMNRDTRNSSFVRLSVAYHSARHLTKGWGRRASRNLAGIYQSRISALLEWKWSEQNDVISANQQVPTELHSDLLLWRNELQLRWFFPIFLWRKWLMVSLILTKPQMHLSSPGHLQLRKLALRCINRFISCVSQISFSSLTFSTEEGIFILVLNRYFSLSQCYVHNTGEPDSVFLPAFPGTFFWLLFQTLLLIGNESIKRKKQQKTRTN